MAKKTKIVSKKDLSYKNLEIKYELNRKAKKYTGINLSSGLKSNLLDKKLMN